MRTLPRLLVAAVLSTLLVVPITASAALVRVKIVTVYSDDPNAPQSFRVGAIKVNIDDLAVMTGDDTDDLRCFGGPNFRHPCSTSSACPGSTCGNPGDNDGDGHDDEELGIARTVIVPGTRVVSISESELRDENGNKFRVGSIRIEETVTAAGKLCKPRTKPEGDVIYLFDDEVDHSSQSDYTIAIRIVPLDAPTFTGGEQCGGEGGNTTKALNKCKRTIVKASADHFQDLVAISTDCALERTTGKSDCSDPKIGARLDKASAAFAKAIGKACGGEDKTCGGDPENEFTPAQIGFAECPTLYGECGGSIENCSDIVACLECIDEFGVTYLLSLEGNIGAPPVAEKPLRKCKEKVLRETSRYSRGESKVFSECNEDQVKDAHPKCLDTVSAAFEKLVAKLRKSVCNACGGKEQKGCGGPDDFTPAQIGFAASCPDIGPCGGFDVTTLEELTFCHVCMSTVIDGCVQSAAFPSGGEYPDECK